MSRIVKLPFQKAAAATTSTTAYRNNADQVVPTLVEISSPKRNDQIKKVIETLCPFLSEKFSDLDIQPLGGGLSNELFVVEQQVLVRIHPAAPTQEDGCSVVDRDVEPKMAAWLADQKMAPIMYGRFENGRIEEFYPNVVPLSCHDMPAFSSQIGTILARFHTLQMPSTILPKPADSSTENSNENNSYTSPYSHFNGIDRWLQILHSKQENGDHKDVEDSSSSLLGQVETEWQWLKNELSTETLSSKVEDTPTSSSALHFIREVVFTHMDCQSLNLLRPKEDNSETSTTSDQPPLKLIDFEYAGWNPRAADLANTFCEFTDMNNLCAKYESEYPSTEIQNIFLLAYLNEANPEWFAAIKENEEILKNAVLPAMRQEIGRFTLLSHIGWTIWSLVKDQEESGIDFDYIQYARHRMDGYKLFKTWFFDQ